MSANLRKQLPKLMMAASLKKPHTRCEILKEITKDKNLCSACREIVKNVKTGNIKLSEIHKRKLRKDREIMLNLLKRRQSHAKQRKLIVQGGKGLMLPLLIPLVAEIIGSFIKKSQEK